MRLSGAFLLNCELFCPDTAVCTAAGAGGGVWLHEPLHSRWRGVVKTFVWIIRGTPLMLQIIVIYLGPGLLGMNNPWPSGSGGPAGGGGGGFCHQLRLLLL